MLLLALSIAPGLAIILYVYRKDSYDRSQKDTCWYLFSWVCSALYRHLF